MPQALNRISLDLHVDLVAKMDAAAQARGCSRAKLARDILTLYFSRIPVPQPTPPPVDTLEDRWSAV